jgi:hypothetical protein
MMKLCRRGLLVLSLVLASLAVPAVVRSPESTASANGACWVRAWVEQGIPEVRVRQWPTTNSATIGWLSGWNQWASAGCSLVEGGWYSCGGRTSNLWVRDVAWGNWYVARMCAWWG